ncbi:hypothetical protein LOCC1_G005827 [Lachnellula occidentalis]|uniref:Uncharacterized protein n=1 Tax=Lachnellula occidentalis TaxID=215460 RepID=A0A8H8RLP4_9HELO|nr:hypothetical protein LOCC1_G005827 [Lachnellula occidentalis]
MSRRDVRTSDPDKSIWLDLTEPVFRQHLVALEERTNAVPLEPRVFTAADWLPPSKTPHTLPLAVEQQVADEFACLVAVEEGAQSVAAVCIEEHAQAPRLTLRFAAMDVSLNDTVQSALEEWSVILSGAAAGNAPLVLDPVEALFHSVIRLHFRRLLARLRSSKWNKPKYLSKSHKKSLWQDMGVLIHRVQFVYAKKERATRALVEKLLGDLTAVYEGFECALGDELTEMEKVVMSSFEFCSAAAVKDYLLRLESSVGARATDQMASALKSLRQIQKIASYRRMSISLVGIAKEYHSLFEGGIALSYLTPYESVPTTIGYEEWATTCHVHAEVQLAVHYDMIPQQKEQLFLKPRAIGISKSLCYLCYRFLLAHQGFFPSRTHGRLYDQWTLPDLAEFDEAIVKRYRNILKDIDEEVCRHTENEPELWRIEPMTSIDVYYTPHQT